MKCLVTGGAGFIGSNLVDRLLARGDEVVCYDNFDTGQIQFLESAQKNARFTLVRGDTLDEKALAAAMAGCDMVFHLAANADVRFGTEHPRKDLEQNTIATYNVLFAMKEAGVRTDRLFIYGLGLRRSARHPDTGGRAVPRSDFALRGIEAGRRGPDLRLLRGL